MDKIVHGLEPNKTYKVRYRAVYSDGRESAPTIAYEITTPDSPAPPKVNQELIEVDSESIPDGVVITWTEPAADPEKPAVSDYFIQITDDTNDWSKFEVATKETKVVLTDKDHSVFWGYFSPVIYIRVFSRSATKLFEELGPTEYREYSYSVETGLRAPDVFTATTPGAYRYNLAWSYIPDRPDLVTAYKIYEASLDGTSYGTLITTITDEADYDYSGGPLISLGGQTLRFAITALDASNNESEPRYSNTVRIGVIDVDFEAPPQRENINFSADTTSADVIVTWTNTGDAADEYLNSDLAGVTIRYALASDPTDYVWIDVPFTYSDNVTTARITGLISNTQYNFQLSTYDVLFNRTTYSTVDAVTTNKDTVPPPKPAPPQVAGGSGNEALIVRVSQYGREPDGTLPDGGTGTPLPPDTSYFQVWMLNSGQTTSPTGATNPNATLLGDMPAGFGGLQTQKIFYVSSIAAGTTRYFYTRAVDTSGNISEASTATQSTVLVYFGDAHVDRLSADKLKAGQIQADTTIDIGTTANRIRIDGVNGSIYSGGNAVTGLGSYGSADTGFFLDDNGTFSLKDRLTFNGTTLSIKGAIEAQSGSFTGNLGITGSLGAIYIGNAPTNGNPQTPANNSIVLRSDGIVARDGSQQTFLLSSNGSLELRGSILAGNAVFNQPVTSNPTGITSRVYYSDSNPNPITISGLPTIEIRKTGSGSDTTGYLSFYKPFGSTQGISFFAQSGETGEGASDTAVMRGELVHNSADYSGGEFILGAYGTAGGNTPGRIRIRAIDSSTGGLGSIRLSANIIYLSKEKDLALDNDLTGTGAAILGINTNNGRVGIYANEIAASARIETSTPTNPSSYPNGAIIAVV
jgi:hypothetical protein